MWLPRLGHEKFFSLLQLASWSSEKLVLGTHYVVRKPSSHEKVMGRYPATVRAEIPADIPAEIPGNSQRWVSDLWGLKKILASNLWATPAGSERDRHKLFLMSTAQIQICEWNTCTCFKPLSFQVAYYVVMIIIVTIIQDALYYIQLVPESSKAHFFNSKSVK